MQTKFLKYDKIFSIIVLFICLSFKPVFAQSQQDSLKFNDNIVFVITNRQTNTIDSKIVFSNEVSKEPSLKYYRVHVLSADSMLITELDSIAFVSAILYVKNDVVLFVHGDSKTFEQAALRGIDIQRSMLLM